MRKGKINVGHLMEELKNFSPEDMVVTPAYCGGVCDVNGVSGFKLLINVYRDRCRGPTVKRYTVKKNTVWQCAYHQKKISGQIKAHDDAHIFT